MIVTMIAVGMVQVALDEIIDMVAMGYGLVPTIGAMFVRDSVTTAIVVGCAALRVLRTDFQDMLLDQRGATGPNRMMQVAIVKVIDMSAVFDAGMAAVRGVLVTAVGMGFGIAHKIVFLVKIQLQRTHSRTQLLDAGFN
jgi:hypothetical protein